MTAQTVTGYLNDIFADKLDPRTAELPLMGSPWTVISLCALYLYFVLGKGQQWMKDRNAYELKAVISAYNVFQILINSYLTVMIGFYAPQQDNYQFFCIPSPRQDFTAVGGIVVFTSYLYYVSRVVDLLDTVFFVLRKKDSQVTFLHVYHHVVMVLGCYMLMKVQSGGGHSTILGFLNSAVHVIMYSYYFLTNYKPELRASLWWKKHITQVQLVQFIILSSYSIRAIFFTDCSEPKYFVWYLLLQSSIMMVLFSNFYYRAYVKQRRVKNE